MKALLPLLWVVGLVFLSACDSGPGPGQASGAAVNAAVVEAGCGQCLLGLKTEKKGCDLAVRIDGKSYFVDGFKMDEFGDAHAKDGMCNATRQAEVVGEIKNDRFVASSFKLVPVAK